jgi:colanic acid biosynthesis glycosyl transferase WcaI
VPLQFELIAARAATKFAMRYLFINQFFWPDEAPTGRLLADLAAELTALGHDVTVVCSCTEYRPGRELDTDHKPDVEIVRVPTLQGGSRRRVRVLSWLSFLLTAGLRSVFLPRADVVVAMTTPPGISLIGYVLKVLRGSRLWIWEMDVYPDIAIATNVVRADSIFTKFVSSLIDFSRKKADGVIAIGECMKRLLVQRGVLASRVLVQENWSEISRQSRVEREPEQPLRVLYSGNLGVAHEVATTKEVLFQLRNQEAVHFTFAGGGSSRKDLEDFCSAHGVDNCEFLPHLNQEELIDRLRSSDVGLVLQKNGCQGAVVPSKFYTLVAAGLPILYVGPSDSTHAATISRAKCGWSFEPGESARIVDLLRLLAQSPKELHRATKAVQAYRAEIGEFPPAAALALQLSGIPSTMSDPAPATAATA